MNIFERYAILGFHLDNPDTEKLKDELEKNNHSLFCFAVERKSIRLLKKLLELGGDINSTGEYNSNVCHLAAYIGDGYVVEFLCENGINFDLQNSDLRTPLHYACLFDNYFPAKVLLRYGANPNLRDENGQTPLHAAAMGHVVEAVELLVKHGADPNALDDYRRNPLHICAIHGSFRVAKELLKHGANPNAKDNDGYTPLELAIELENDEIANVLSS